MFELGELNVSTYYTGSVYMPMHLGAAPSQGAIGTGVGTGSWQGLAATWGVDDEAVNLLASSSGGVVNLGTWNGIAYSYALNTTPTESIDRFSLTNDANPSINQSVGIGEWDPFPLPPEPPEPPTKIRDITRYVKTYSSQRLQVQRIRYTRKRTVT